MAIHLESKDCAATAVDTIFLYDEEDIRKWRKHKTIALQHCFQEVSFEKVSLSCLFYHYSLCLYVVDHLARYAMSQVASLVIESPLNENGAFTTAAEAKAIVGELQAECFRGKITMFFYFYQYQLTVSGALTL